MPNWCHNSAVISHEDPAKIAELLHAIHMDNMFNHFIPLPNGQWDRSFCVDHWGTKWDIGHVQIGNVEKNSISFSFDTAWSPPEGVYRRMHELGYSIKAEYAEAGCDYCGQWIDGVDDCHKLTEAPTHLKHLADEYGFTEEEAA